MKIREALTVEQKKQLGVKEQLSRREIEDLMGMRRDTYKRENGKIKRK